MKKKITIIIAVLVLILACVVLALTISGKNEKKVSEPTKVETKETEKTAEPSKETEAEEEQKVYTPTFMYFVSDEDANKAETDKMIEELKKEYEGKVNFDIRNITQTPEDGENFPVKGATPALIMLNTNNDICAMEFMCADKEKLANVIESALAK